MDDEYLNGYAKLCGINATGVYLSLCRHANKEQRCFPSKKLIAEELAISERSVYTALKTLEIQHIIKIEQQGRKEDGSFKNLVYTLLDKKVWTDKPSATGAVGKKRQSPSANDDTTRRQQVPNKETHINQTHINHSNAVALRVDAPIISVIDSFKVFNKAAGDFYGNKTQRKFAQKLVDTYGQEKVDRVITALPTLNRKLYNKATTPKELWDKWAKIEAEAQGLKEKRGNYSPTKIY